MSSMKRGRGLRASVVAMAVLALIAGCAQIPRTSAVKEVGPISVQNDGLGHRSGTSPLAGLARSQK